MKYFFRIVIFLFVLKSYNLGAEGVLEIKYVRFTMADLNIRVDFVLKKSIKKPHDKNIFIEKKETGDKIYPALIPDIGPFIKWPEGNNKEGYIYFNNNDLKIKRGDRVKIVIGKYVFDNLKIPIF